MPVGFLRVCACALIALCAGGFPVAYGQTVLLNEDHTIATADEFVPAEHSFDITVAGSYQVTLTDLGAALTPSVPLASVQLAITSNGAIVGTPLVAAGTSAPFTAAVGHYTVHVVGTLTSGVASGEIGIKVTSADASDVVATFSDQVALPATATPANENFLDDTFTVPSAGSYEVTLNDLTLPQALAGVTLAIFDDTGALLTSLPTAGSIAVPLQPGINYRIFAIGQADPTANAGLYSVIVAPAGGGSDAFQRNIPVGGVQLLTSGQFAAGTYTLAAADLALPTALGQISVDTVVNGAAVAQVSAATAGAPQTFTTGASSYQVFALATAAAGGAGSYTVTLSPQAGSALVSLARAVVDPTSSIVPYSYDTTVTAGGAYALNLADFNVAVKFQALTAAVVQGGVVLGTPLQAQGSANVTTVVGPASILVFATPDPTGSLFGIDLTAAGATAALFETTQGVGQLFTGRQISVTAAGNYGVTVSDVGFPDKLDALDVIITRGASTVGAVYGAGQIVLAATPGVYFVNFIAQPKATAKAGTYSVTIASAPVVSLTTSANAVDSGGTVTLTWTSQGATSCSASGGWSGSQNLQGSATTAAISAAATFTLTCSGVGGQTAQSVSVTVNPVTNKGGGGGGSVGWDVLLLLCSVVALRLRGLSSDGHAH